MDASERTVRPSVAQYVQRAQELFERRRAADPEAIRRVAAHHPRFRGVSDHHASGNGNGNGAGHAVRGATFGLADAELVLAREHGFETWRAFAAFIEGAADPDSPVARFEGAVDAVVTGNESALRSLLLRQPDLVRARSAREHHATLLHYVAACGVEAFRKHTPDNIVDITKLLLAAGAEPDATVETSGTPWTTLMLVVSSLRVTRAGVSAPLIETLLDFDAAIDGLPGCGPPLMAAIALPCREAVEVLIRRGARVDNVVAAAALGRLDAVKRFIAAAGEGLAAGGPIAWPGIVHQPGSAFDRAFIQACVFGRPAVVERLLDAGVDPAVTDRSGLTGLHYAGYYGQLPTVRLLLARRAPLEAKNAFGGTVLSYVVWGSVHSGLKLDYVSVVETLIEAGARMDAIDFPSANPPIADVFRRHGVTA